MLCSHLQPCTHVKEAFLKGRDNTSVSCWSHIQKEVTVTGGRGGKLPQEMGGVPEPGYPLGSIVAPRAHLNGVATLPLVRHQLPWSVPKIRRMKSAWQIRNSSDTGTSATWCGPRAYVTTEPIYPIVRTSAVSQLICCILIWSCLLQTFRAIP